jgi:DNA (cytosine-5)-methyltransferase 1
MQLVLSLFPGIDLLGRGFEAEGFAVVRGPDILWGGDIRDFTVPAGRFDGVVGGSPCQDFSKLRRSAPTGYGLEMIAEFQRVVIEAAPRWWLLENVPGVPDVSIDGYSVQRFDLRASEVGLRQSRLRHFQYGNADGLVLVLPRPEARRDLLPAAVASEDRRDWAEFCEIQGLPSDFDVPGMSKGAKYRAVGNGVPVPMGRFVARACLSPVNPLLVRLCACNCGRPVYGKQRAAGAGCRKRLERARRESVTGPAPLNIEGTRMICDSSIALQV